MNDNRIKIEEEESFFGAFYPYVCDDFITDIDYNGKDCWLTDCNNGRFLAKEHLENEFMEQFTKRIANLVSKPFHKQNPILEAETEKLRITIVHESVAISGRSICIRKSLPIVRLKEEEMVREGYVSEDVFALLKQCVQAKMNLIFVGEPGVGKTECAKFFSQYIDERERVITIEDTSEWHYSKLHPNKDCIELRVNSVMDYTKAIKTCLRLNPTWMMLSEVRSKEVKYLLEGFSTGVRGMTTLHTDDVRKVPDRIITMAGMDDTKRLENDIYTFLDVAVLLKRKEVRQKDGYKVIRCIEDICYFSRENGNNKITMLVEGGRVVADPLPSDIQRRFSGNKERKRTEQKIQWKGGTYREKREII